MVRKFSLSDFVNKAKDTIQLVFSEYSKVSFDIDMYNYHLPPLINLSIYESRKILRHWRTAMRSAGKC